MSAADKLGTAAGIVRWGRSPMESNSIGSPARMVHAVRTPLFVVGMSLAMAERYGGNDPRFRRAIKRACGGYQQTKTLVVRSSTSHVGKQAVASTRPVSCRRISMGGSMSYAVACAVPDVFRAAAVHSGGPMSGCVVRDKLVAYFMTHGEQDGTCTYPA